MEFLKAIKSVMAAMIGVQKADTLREDFSKKSAMPFIVAGIIMTIVFVLTVYGLVKIVLSQLKNYLKLIDQLSFKKTPPTFLSDFTFMLFINVDRTYATLSDFTFMLFINVDRTYAKLSDFTSILLETYKEIMQR